MVKFVIEDEVVDTDLKTGLHFLEHFVTLVLPAFFGRSEVRI
jgi:hypothetical protein